MRRVVVMSVLLLTCGSAGADILQWQDADGVTHYTNLAQEVPAEYRPTARVIVDESVRAGRAVPEAEPAAVRSESSEPRMAQVVFDRSPTAEAYVQGLNRGLALARTSRGTADAGIHIRGPLAVAHATATAPTLQRHSFPWSGYPYPLVTTSFDRGRSRHLTLRMLMQDKLSVERESLHGFGTRHDVRRRPQRLSVDIDRRLLRAWREEAAAARADR